MSSSGIKKRKTLGWFSFSDWYGVWFMYYNSNAKKTIFSGIL